MHGKATNGGRDAAATVKFSKRAAGCLGGTVREGGGRLSSALSVGYTQSLACFRQVAESAETVEVIIPHLVGSKTGGICCYRTQSGSAHLPLSPGSEGQPAIRPWFSPDKGTLLRQLEPPAHSNFFGFWPPRGKACYYFIYQDISNPDGGVLQIADEKGGDATRMMMAPYL